MQDKPSNIDYYLNPYTNRLIKKSSATYRKIYRELLKRQQDDEKLTPPSEIKQIPLPKKARAKLEQKIIDKQEDIMKLAKENIIKMLSDVDPKCLTKEQLQKMLEQEILKFK